MHSAAAAVTVTVTVIITVKLLLVGVAVKVTVLVIIFLTCEAFFLRRFIEKLSTNYHYNNYLFSLERLFMLLLLK